jgi:hypothetical protein
MPIMQSKMIETPITINGLKMTFTDCCRLVTRTTEIMGHNADVITGKIVIGFNSMNMGKGTTEKGHTRRTTNWTATISPFKDG